MENEDRVAMQLLLWPSSLVIIDHLDVHLHPTGGGGSSSNSSRRSGDGFVLGWSNHKEEASTPPWPAATIVVAGMEWLPRDSKSVPNEYQALQRRVAALHGHGHCCCRCRNHHHHHHNRKPNDTRQENQSLLEGLEVVAYVSLRATIPVETKRWLDKEGLPHGESYNGLPCWGGGENQEQVVLYDPQKVYRHTASGPESVFGKLLAQASSATSILGHLARVQDPSAAASTAPSNTQPKAKSRAKPNAKDNLSPEEQGQSVWRRALERYSMLACHVRSMRSRRAGITTTDPTNGHCNVCQKPILGPMAPQEDPAANDSIRKVLDSVTGLLLGMFLVSCWSWGGGALSSFASSYFVEQQFLQEWLTWLESFPIGFKLNVPLTQSIGQEIRSLVVWRHRILNTIALKATSLFSSPGHPHGILGIQSALVFTSTALGGSGSLALLMDLLRLLTIHLALLSEGFRYVYSTELYLLGSMWRLFRGKKQNILRERTDTMEYDSMQLLLGSILFVVTLFLLTTILLYYAFFTLLNLVARTGASVALWALYVFLQDFPFGTCYLRSLHPELFTSQVVIREEPGAAATTSSTSSTKRLVTRLEPMPESFGSILASTPKLRQRGIAFKTWLSACLSDIASGTPTSKTLVESLEGDSSQ